MKKRVTPEMLRLAAEWCESYEPSCDDAIELTAVADWLRSEADRKEKAALVYRIMSETGCARARAISEADKLWTRLLQSKEE